MTDNDYEKNNDIENGTDEGTADNDKTERTQPEYKENETDNEIKTEDESKETDSTESTESAEAQTKQDDAVNDKSGDTRETSSAFNQKYTQNQQYTYGVNNVNGANSVNAGSDRTYNPYFSGYGNADNKPTSGTQPSGSSDAQNAQNAQNTQNTQNTQNGQTRSTNPAEHRPTGYYNPYQNGQNQFSRSNGISYTPTPSPKAKKKKTSKGISGGALAAVILLTAILCGAAGFGGAMLASKGASSRNTQKQYAAESGNASDTDNGMVVYRAIDVEEVETSVKDGEAMTYVQVAAAVKDSVVEINTEYTTQSLWFQYVSQGAGSGVIISKDGYIITNAHVILNESTGTVADDITVRLTDESEYKAEVKSYDSDADIAILKVEAENLCAAVCGDSKKLAAGEEVIVVGNPLGQLGGSVTNGIVSATEREIDVNGVAMTLIQTNAAVNPGNSGGGMFNMKGQLIGIVNAKSSGTEIEGIGFAIPIDRALEVSEQLLTYGYVRGKVMIGVTFQDVSSSNYFYYYNIKAGVYVAELTPGYNDSVLEVGDRIIAVNGEEVTSYSEIKSIVSASAVGDKLKFQLYRDNKLMEVEVTCYEKVPTDANIEFNADADKSSIPGSLSDFFN